MGVSWVGKVSDFLGAAVLQTNRCSALILLICNIFTRCLLTLLMHLWCTFQPQADSNQYGSGGSGSGGGYYGYAPGQENYGYAPVAQDPNMYYGGYPGYANNYQQQPPQQQQVGYSWVLKLCESNNDTPYLCLWFPFSGFDCLILYLLFCLPNFFTV